MDGYEVTTLDDALDRADIIITATGNKDIITAPDMERMKHQAIVGNIGHFDNEIDMAGLRRPPGSRAGQHQAPGRQVGLPRRPRLIIYVGGPPLLNLGNATGHPSFVMSNSFTNQTMAQLELFSKAADYSRTRSTCCPSTSTRRSPCSTSTRSA